MECGARALTYYESTAHLQSARQAERRATTRNDERRAKVRVRNNRGSETTGGRLSLACVGLIMIGRASIAT